MMPMIPADNFRDGGPISRIPDAQLSAFGTAMVSTITSLTEGECAGCFCDVCVSLRGLLTGVRTVLDNEV